MVILQITRKSLNRRKIKAAIALVALACSISLVLLLVHLKNNLALSIERVTNKADLIVGAPAQPTHLALFGLLHIGTPPPPFSASLFETLKSHEEIRTAIPFSMLESHRGITITGTTQELFQHLAPDESELFEQGEGFIEPESIVLGATLAEKTGYKVGEYMTIAAGSEPSFKDEYPQHFKVTGILLPTDNVIDNSAFAPIDTLMAIRQERGMKTEQDINLILLTLHNRQALLPMQNLIREMNPQAVEVIIPSHELDFIRYTGNQLVNLMLGIVIITLLMALIAVFFSVSSSLAERRYEIETLRMLGARTHQMIIIGLLEPVLIIMAASILGFGLFWIGTKGLEYSLPDIWKGWVAGHSVSLQEVGVLLILVMAGTGISAIPAWITLGQCTRLK